MTNDVYFTKRCEVLAVEAAAKRDAPVGSVIIKDDKIISEAIESAKYTNDITCHAELEAMRIAVKKLKTNDLSDCVIYSTHEPCIICSMLFDFIKYKSSVSTCSKSFRWSFIFNAFIKK